MSAKDLRQKGYVIEVLLERGRERFRRGASTVALQLWEEALAVDPEEPRALSYIDYVRQNWDEVDGAVDAPLPDVSDLKPNYPIESEPETPPVGNVIAPVAGQVDTADVEKRRAELAALEERIAGARAEVERLAGLASAAPAGATAGAAAIPDPIHDAATPRGTVELQLGGVAGDGWSVAAEPIVRSDGGRPAAAAAEAEPEQVAAAIASELAPPASELVAAIAPGAGEVSVAEGISLTDAAMAPAIGPLGSDEGVTHPRLRLPTDAELDAMDEATALYPRRLAAAAMAELGARPVAAPTDAPPGAAGDASTDAAAPAAIEAAGAAGASADEDAAEAALARTPTPVMAGRTSTPLIPGRTILGAPDGLLPVPDADFERDLEAALGAAAIVPDDEVPGGAPGAAAPVPTALGDDGFEEELDLDLPPPVGEHAAAEPVLAADAPVAPVQVPPSEPAEAATPAAAAPAPASDPFADDRPTVWSAPPPAAAAMMTMAERVEQAMARGDDAFGESVTTSWQAPPAELLEATRRPELPPPAWVQPYTPPAAEQPDPAAELAAQMMSEPLLPPVTPATEDAGTMQLPRIDAPTSPAEPELSVFDRITTALPITREDVEEPLPARTATPSIARTPTPSMSRTPTPTPSSTRMTVPMAAARTTATMPAAEPEPEAAPGAEPSDGLDDIELAPRSGVGLGADVPVRLDVRELANTIDDIGPLARSTGHPAPASPEPSSLAGEEPLEDSDLLAEDDDDEQAAAPARTSTLPLPPVPVAPEEPSSTRASTLDLRPGVELPAPLAESPLPVSASSEIRLPRTSTAERPAIGSFDGPEAQTVTVLPPSLDLLAAAPSAGMAPHAELGDEDPFELPTAPITPLAEPPAIGRTEAEPPAARPAAAPPEEPAAGPRAKTLEFLPPGAVHRWGAVTPAARDGYQADTADLSPRLTMSDDDGASPARVRTQTPIPRDKVDTVDLGPSTPAWQGDEAEEAGGRLEPAPAWQPPPLEPAPAWAAPPPPPAPRPSVEPIELPDPTPMTARTATPRPAVEGLRRGDELWARDEHLGARLSPEVLRGLGLTSVGASPSGASPGPTSPPPLADEPTRDGWPTGRRPAPPRTLTPRPSAEPVRPRTGPDAAALAQLDDLMPPPAGAADLGLDDLELPSPPPGGGVRTPGEVLLRSSAPEALAAALASELDRGAPSGESPDDRARRRITALLEKASAAARAGEHPLSIAAIDLALSEAPDSAVAQKLVHRSRDIILDCYTRYFGDLSRRPVPVGSLAELTGRALDPRAAFLVSRMDGTLTYEEILDVAGMGRLEACRHLAQLLVRGIIRAS